MVNKWAINDFSLIINNNNHNIWDKENIKNMENIIQIIIGINSMKTKMKTLRHNY